MDDIAKKLDQLSEINNTLREILAAVAKPKPKENKLVRILELIAIAGGVTTFITAADIIRNWILGG